MRELHPDDAYLVECSRCGKYEISRTAAACDKSKYGPRYQLSGAIRNLQSDEHPPELNDRTLDLLLDSVRIPSGPIESIDLLLEHISRRTERPGETTKLNPSQDYPLVYAHDGDEFSYYVNNAEHLGYLETTTERDHVGYRLSLKGWQRLDDLRKSSKRSDQAFVAMSFDPSLDEAWSNGIKPALKECGYDPLRVDREEHNEKICDKIISDIRKSSLVVADFTGQPGGVYFEAGFALGLDIEVIWSCKEDEVDDLHFDTRQYNHILWQTPEDLAEKLENRIRATIPSLST